MQAPRASYLCWILAAWLLLCAWPGQAHAQDEGAIIDRVRADYLRMTQNPRLRNVYRNWQLLYDRCARVYQSDPQGEQSALALWWMAHLRTGAYENFGRPNDFNEAKDLLRRFLNHFPRTSMAEDAQFDLGRLYEKAGDKQQAYLEYLKVTTNYPRGEKVAQAKQRLDVLERELKGKVRQRPPEVASHPGGRPTATPPSAPAATPPSAAPAAPVAVDAGLSALTDLRHWSTSSYTRLVVSMERPVHFTTNIAPRTSGGHSYLHIDLKGARLRKPMDDRENQPRALMNLAQASQASPDSVRVVVELKQLASYKVFTLDNPFRLIVDCYGDQASAPGAPPAAAQPAQPAQPQQTAQAAPPAEDGDEGEETAQAAPPANQPPQKPGRNKKPLSTRHARKVPRGQAQQIPSQLGLATQLGLCVNRVVIDPGHGGKDPGAIWHGIKEKDIVLDIAKRVREKVARLTGCDALLTRSKDVFVPLEDRTAFANTHDADLFVSIHINAASSPGLNGIETYFLNLASDEQSMRVAARENATTHRTISDLQNILNDLMLNSKINESNHLARTLHRNLLSQVRLRYQVQDLKVKQAPFYVLIGARMPAVLIEVGFLTNPQEHQRLNNPAYRDQVAEGIAQGIAAYSRDLKTAAR